MIDTPAAARPHHPSIWCWAVLTTALGGTLALAPAFAFSLIGQPLPPSAEPWARLSGLVAIGYSAGYWICALFDGVPFMRASVALRLLGALCVVSMAAAGALPSTLLGLGALDLAGAAWTWAELALRARSARHESPA